MCDKSSFDQVFYYEIAVNHSFGVAHFPSIFALLKNNGGK